ncbi:MAG TPA: Fe-S cluster assembly ATPase SufC, partial [Patescibacteria group bacterium]|nr:Fe-S cluster assembly ATPase SufC [Patescibacteria group bacterium]
KSMRLPAEFLTRSLNEGFSGGEKKKAEILQLAMLAPKLVVLDETDSGLDVDALKIVGREVNKLKKNGVSVIIITHYNRVLKYIEPDFVHIMYHGRIIKSGRKDLAHTIEKGGYNQFIKTKQKG